MNRYHFNYRRGEEVFPDPLGLYLPSDEEAFNEAIRTWRDLLAGGDTGEKRDSSIEVTDADGTVIGTIPLGYVERLKEG